MKINWKVRLKNKTFWVSIIPALLLLIQQICSLFGITLELNDLSDKLIAITGTVFSALALLGIVNDPTTQGLSDSARAMTYEKPKGDE